MAENKDENRYNKKTILDDLMRIIMEIASGWEMQFEGQIRPETLLGAELAFKSLDFVRLVSSIQQRYIHKSIPFDQLFVSDDGVILEDLKVSDLVDFLYKQLNHA